MILVVSCSGDDDIQYVDALEHQPNKDQKFFSEKVQPILDNRCVVCHSCNDAPCELKLNSWEGIKRGASKLNTYDSSLLDRKTVRLGIDAKSSEEWHKEYGFWPVLNKTVGDDEIDVDASPLAKLVRIKRDEDHVKSLNVSYQSKSSRQCPSVNIYKNKLFTLPLDNPLEELEQFEENMSWAGMPYGFPKLSEIEYDILDEWFENGAPGPDGERDHRFLYAGEVEKWEGFFNKGDKKSRLVSRYIYEHLFMAHIHFDDSGRQFFRLIRSSTRDPLKPVEIATRRPLDNPGQEFFYRFVPVLETITVKNHLPYQLNPKRMSRYKDLFFKDNWHQIKREKDYNSYEDGVSSNPYDVYAEIPEKSRYQFLLDEAKFFVNTFIRGPVCNGPVATNVINEHFWVVFLDPNFDPAVKQKNFLYKNREDLGILPVSAAILTNFGYVFDSFIPDAILNTFVNNDLLTGYVKNTNEFNRKYHKILSPELKGKPIQVEHLWNGDNKTNDNAILTVFRNFDNAAVVKGARGDIPKTAWLMNYQIFETVYYNLTAGFDVYSNVVSQAATRIFMENSRFASEDLFLNLISRTDRMPLREYWSRDAHGEDWARRKKMIHKFINYDEKAILSVTNTVKETSYEKNRVVMSQIFTAIMKQYGQKVSGGFDFINCYECEPKERKAAHVLSTTDEYFSDFKVKGELFVKLPELSYIQITSHGNILGWYTMLKHSAHKNVAALFGEELRLEPSRYTVEFHRGIIGAYPNLFFRVELDEIIEFLRLLSRKDMKYGNEILNSKYAIGRDHHDFWKISDQLRAFSLNPVNGGSKIAGGVFDLGRYENIFSYPAR